VAGFDPSAEDREIAALPRLGRTARLLLLAGAAGVGGVAALHYGLFGWDGPPLARAEPDQRTATAPAPVDAVAEPRHVEQTPAAPQAPPDQPKPAPAPAAVRPPVAAQARQLKSMDVQVDYKPPQQPDEMDGRVRNRWPSCTLYVGQRIPVALDQLVISEVRAPIGGVVREDVHAMDDPAKVLIPQGSRVTGAYQNTDLGPERRRLDASFDYVTRPDGSVIRLGGAAAVDVAGAGGVPGKVVTHWPTWFFNTVALWMIGAAEQQGNASAGGAGSAAGAVESSGAQAVGQNGRAAVAASLNFRPTITIRAGTLINLVMTRMDRAC
jgi:type IV secretory pathway VirB10-like protein